MQNTSPFLFGLDQYLSTARLHSSCRWRAMAAVRVVAAASPPCASAVAMREMLLARSRATLPAIPGHKPRHRGIVEYISRLLSRAHLQAVGAAVGNQVLADQVACVIHGVVRQFVAKALVQNLSDDAWRAQ